MRSDVIGAKGLHGKIHGPIKLGNPNRLHAEKPYLMFNYYLNPANDDTNIEFDPARKLFNDMPQTRQVTGP